MPIYISKYLPSIIFVEPYQLIYTSHLGHSIGILVAIPYSISITNFHLMESKTQNFLYYLDLSESLEGEPSVFIAQKAKEPKGGTAKQTSNAQWLPILILNKTVLFPGVFMHLTIREKNTINLIEEAYKKIGSIGVVAPKKNTSTVNIKNLYSVGTRAKVHKMVALSEDQMIVVLQGEERFQIQETSQTSGQVSARVTLLAEDSFSPKKQAVKALVQAIKETTLKTLSLIPEAPVEIRMIVENIQDPVLLTYHIAANMTDFQHKQRLLEVQSGMQRATLLLKYLLKNLHFAKLKHKIQDKVDTGINQQQRNFYLKQQIRALQNETRRKC